MEDTADVAAAADELPRPMTWTGNRLMPEMVSVINDVMWSGDRFYVKLGRNDGDDYFIEDMY